ncbi:MAG: hypothetical protein ABJE10_22505 [bacterium]
MTVGEWLRTRAQQPPAALAARLDAVLGNSLSLSSERTPDVCLAAGEHLVAELLRNNSTSRDSALDLLTADALVTYAFEAASESPSAIEARASAAMTRIAALGAARLS